MGISGGVAPQTYTTTQYVGGGYGGVAFGQGITQAAAGAQIAYEVKTAQHDPQLRTLKQVKAASGLRHVDVMDAAMTFRDAAMQNGGRLSRDQFMDVKAALLDAKGVQQPSQEVSNA